MVNEIGVYKISKSLTGKPLSEAHKRALSVSHKGQIPYMKGKHHTNETKEKMSVAKKGKPSPNKGRKVSIETLIKMKQHKGWKHTEKSKEKIRLAGLNRKVSAETKYKIALSNHKPVTQYNKDMVFIRTYNSAIECAKTNNYKYHSLIRCLTGNRKTFMGFLWKYEGVR